MGRTIDRRQFLQTGTAGLAAGALPRGARADIAPPPPKPWNVLYVISDQHQAACMGAEGHPQAITPNMDSLARRGVRFARPTRRTPSARPAAPAFSPGSTFTTMATTDCAVRRR